VISCCDPSLRPPPTLTTTPFAVTVGVSALKFSKPGNASSFARQTISAASPRSISLITSKRVTA
jgi:hypothetical protein